MFWQGELFKATWLGTTHRWGQKTRCLLTAFDEAVLFQEIGDVVLISPTFSQTDLFCSLHEFLIIGLWGTKKTHPREVSPLGFFCVPAFLRSLRFGLRGETCWGEKPTPRRRTDMLTDSGCEGLLHAPHYKNFSAKGISTKLCTWRAKMQWEWVFQSLRVPSLGPEVQINTFYCLPFSSFSICRWVSAFGPSLFSDSKSEYRTIFLGELPI